MEALEAVWQLRYVLAFTAVVTAGALWAETHARGDVQVPAPRDGSER